MFGLAWIIAGGPDFSCQNFVTGGLYEYSLHYHKKGSEEWGTPFDFTVSTKDESGNTDRELLIYPNPARDVLNISIAAENQISVIIYHPHGIMLWNRELDGNFTTIDIVNYHPACTLFRWSSITRGEKCTISPFNTKKNVLLLIP